MQTCMVLIARDLHFILLFLLLSWHCASPLKSCFYHSYHSPECVNVLVPYLLVSLPLMSDLRGWPSIVSAVLHFSAFNAFHITLCTCTYVCVYYCSSHYGTCAHFVITHMPFPIFVFLCSDSKVVLPLFIYEAYRNTTYFIAVLIKYAISFALAAYHNQSSRALCNF